MKKIILTLFLITLLGQLASAQSTVREALSDQESTNKKYTIELYPNPVVEYLNIKSEGSKFGDMDFELYSLIGNKLNVRVEERDKDHFRIRIDKFAAGHYLLVVKDKETRFRQAFKFQKL